MRHTLPLMSFTITLSPSLISTQTTVKLPFFNLPSHFRSSDTDRGHKPPSLKATKTTYQEQSPTLRAAIAGERTAVARGEEDGEKRFSGGIWCLWDDSSVVISVAKQLAQFIYLKATYGTDLCWWLTIVYASPNSTSRRVLWNELSILRENIQGAWMVGGDFNATLLDRERRSLAVHRLHYDRDFMSWIEHSNIVDVGFVGPEFTWKRGNTEARLDRVVANDDWLSRFPNAIVSHLPFFKSDHRPLLICTEQKMCQ